MGMQLALEAPVSADLVIPLPDSGTPAAIGYACGLQGGWDWLVLGYFVACGVSRLARSTSISAGEWRCGVRK